jgi:hypothetical protein
MAARLQHPEFANGSQGHTCSPSILLSRYEKTWAGVDMRGGPPPAFSGEERCTIFFPVHEDLLEGNNLSGRPVPSFICTVQGDHNVSRQPCHMTDCHQTSLALIQRPSILLHSSEPEAPPPFPISPLPIDTIFGQEDESGITEMQIVKVRKIPVYEFINHFPFIQCLGGPCPEGGGGGHD